MLYCFLSAIGGGVAIGLLWFLAERTHARVIRDLLADADHTNQRLNNAKRLSARLGRECDELKAQLAPFIASRSHRDPVTKKFQKAA